MIFEILASPGSLLEALGSLLGPLGVVLGRSWGLLGRSWAILGRSFGILRRSWGAQGRLWGRMGRSGTAPGTHRGHRGAAHNFGITLAPNPTPESPNGNLGTDMYILATYVHT